MTAQREIANGSDPSFHKISVIVPANPFIRGTLHEVRHCLAALDVVKLMDWWPGKPHFPRRNPDKVSAIQRSLDWKRVAQIATYLLQREIVGAPEKVERYFSEIYATNVGEPGRDWPPQLPKVARFQRSGYPTFSNVLLHVNGAKLDETSAGLERGVANLVFDENSPSLDFYKRGEPPRHQAQIFIDVNFYQKKVDRSLVADLFPTARGPREPLDDKERAQDLG
jgi:hypothetical protein